MDEVLEEFQTKHPDITILKINVDNEKELQRDYEVTAIPTYFLVQDGDIIDSTSGARPLTELEKFVYDQP